MDVQIARVEAHLNALQNIQEHQAPILFFNASTRIHRLSLNGAYSLLASWALRAQGHPVRYLVCQQGMVQCILGTHPQKPGSIPPCTKCMRVSRRLFPDELIVPLDLDTARAKEAQGTLEKATIEELMDWMYREIPLGHLVLPGLRWALRRHHLEDDESTRLFYRQYLASCVSMVRSFDQILAEVQPKAVVLFNGIFYPEALLRHMAQQQGIPTITHEVGLQPFSAFFSHQEATFREVGIDAEDDLKPREKTQLDAYLKQRFQGQFSMAGIQFWGRIGDLPENLVTHMEKFSTVVPIFTNVIFDTSQIHANTIFPDMFTWLDGLVNIIDKYPDVLFALRAHPDEDRPGKSSAESVSAWVRQTGVDQRNNVVFIGPDQELSSYKLIEQSKFALVYNSSIGLEASILGKPILCAGRARYTQAETVFFPQDERAYWDQLERMLAETQIKVPGHFRVNAEKFLYHELFRASIDLSEFLESDPTLPGMVALRDFMPEQLLVSPSLQTLSKGILLGKKFLLGA